MMARSGNMQTAPIAPVKVIRGRRAAGAPEATGASSATCVPGPN
jgi:hypothetical protein